MFDKSEIKTNYDAQKRTDIMFIGGYNHTPNKDAALWLVNNIMPLVWEKNPDIKLHLIGSNPPNEILALSSNKIIIHGYVSDEDLDKIYNDIKLSVVPLRYGAGVKGKILESIKNSVPVITTDIGIEGIPNKNEFIIVKNTEQEIAQAIVDLYPDNKKLNKISKNCLPFISKNYSESATMNLFNKWLDIK
jgi:glycosyltransferase involved in cell wall biosynthesis